MKRTNPVIQITKLSLVLFILLLSITLNTSGFVYSTENKDHNMTSHSFLSTIEGNSVLATSSHILTINYFSHYNRPIYANYTVIKLEMKLESEEASITDLHLYYSHNLINWTTEEFEKINDISDNSSLFSVHAGPFLYSGDYYLKINATRGSNQLVEFLFIITIQEVTGIIFTDFTYQIMQLENGTQVINVQIFVLGEDIDNSTIEIEFDQPERTNTSIPMMFIAGSINQYNSSIGPVNEWLETVHITFKANDTIGKEYTNNNFYFVKGKPIYPENFLTSKLPAILAGLLGAGAMAGIFILAKRKPPKSFE